LQSISAGQIDGSEERTVTLKVHGKDSDFSGQRYFLNPSS
jgi:hypothetical protein